MKVSEIGLAFHQAILNQEFIVYYQPKVSLGSGELCGAEALVRWDKDGTVKQPQDFLPALENDGTICELDFYVFERVCMDIRTWMEKGMEPVTISVNLSKCHLKNEDTASKIIAILERYSVDPEYIEIEMTEIT
jgi:EAL domain-containing protein (putative c-di-GMP-specific phosphodiesterase class I)